MSNNNVQHNMERELKDALCSVKYCCDNNLKEDIWCVILRRNQKLIKIKLYVFSSILFISAAGLVPMLINLWGRLASSGVYQYSSLAFSDISSILTMWKEFGLLLFEALPMMSILLSSLLFLLLIVALRNTMKQLIIRNQLSF